MDVLFTDDAAEALVYCGGIKSIAVDFVKIKRNEKKVNKWFEAREDTNNKRFNIIGTRGDILLQEMDDGGVHAITEKY